MTNDRSAAMLRALKWALLAIAMAFVMGWVADEQAALESAWGKPMHQNEEWRW